MDNRYIQNYGLSPVEDFSSYGLTPSDDMADDIHMDDALSKIPAGQKMVDTFIGKIPPFQSLQQMVPKKEDIQKAAGMALPFVAPEIGAIPLVSNLLSKIPLGSAIGNTLGRIGYGTGLTAAPELLSKEGREQFPERLKSHAIANTLLEGLTMPFRGLRGMAELFNPINFARGKAAQIKSEHDAAKSVMEENYRPINEAYGHVHVSADPKRYLQNSGIERKKLYSDAKFLYDDFINNPTYKNLLNLKSQVGRDWAKISPSDKINKIQLFNRYRNTLDNNVKNFLSRDPNMINQYELANKYAENVYYPYVSTPTLKRISKGKFDAVYPDKMADSMEKATQRVVGAEHKYRIPKDHPLRNHLNQLKNRIGIGDISEIAIPTLLGGIAGELLNPGAVGIGAGLSSGFGTGVGSKMLKSKMLQYPVVQSPAVQNIFNKATPYFYKAGRVGISASDEN